jgi:hypothetical protein
MKNYIKKKEQTNNLGIPKIVFIVPYRDRELHLDIFKKQMIKVMEDYNENDYNIIYVHQCDDRSFNRGAMKNIGFLFIKNNFPHHYKDITFVFNDVDTTPKEKNIIPYETNHKIIKHFYGYKYTLGGIVSIKGNDFETLNGFPNYWAWGYEDNALQQRTIGKNMIIDRSIFYKIRDPHILHLNDSKIRTINKTEYKKYANKINDGINSISNLKYVYDSENSFVNVLNFDTPYLPNNVLDIEYNLDNGNVPFSNRSVASMKLNLS